MEIDTVLMLIAAIFLNPFGLIVLLQLIYGKITIKEKVELLVKYLAVVIVIGIVSLIYNHNRNTDSNYCVDYRGYYEC